MSQHATLSRRSLLQFFAGAPMLPLASTMASAGLLSACGGGNGDGPAYLSASFSSMSAPTLSNAAALATTTVSGTLSASFDDGSTQSFNLGYQTFFRTGDQVPDGKGGTVLAGGYVDIKGNPILDNSVAGKSRQFFSDCPDGTTLLTVPSASVSGVKGNTVFAVVQFEYTSRNQALSSMYGLLSAPVAVLTLDQDPNTGKLSLVKYSAVDTSGVNGLWITCGASLSPWGTHLSSEEYPPDANLATNTQLAGFSLNVFGDATQANPYHYGFLPEVSVNADGTGSVKKHYCTGRTSKELACVMADNRTVLMGDDWTNGGAFMFIADKEKDLSAGSLYVAKWTQTSGTGPGAATLSWIKLGSATSAEIKALIDSGIKCSDIFDIKTADPADTSYTKIPFSGTFNWVKLKPGMDKAAAFLETHRYAALKGGSMGFTKWEGTTVNAKDKIAYIAMSRIESSMLNGSGDVKVQGPYSGAVYAQNLTSGVKDTAGTAINSEWVPVDMAAVPALISEDLGATTDKPYPKLAKQDALGNFANPDKIATPDNLKFSEKLRTLFIGEDSNTHVNNFVWAYNVDTKKLSRILSAPAGAECTGLFVADNVNGFTYIMSNFQHAGDWETPLHSIVKPTVEPLINANYNDRFGASVGYITAASGQIYLGAR